MHFRLISNASGPEIVDLGALSGPLLPQSPLEKVGASPPNFSNGFCGRRGLFRPTKSAISTEIKFVDSDLTLRLLTSLG